MSPESDSLQKVLALANQFGGIGNIPVDQLAAAGYAIVSPGRVAPIGFTPEPPPAQPTPEDKFDERPFDVISAELTNSGVKYKRIAGPELEILKGRVHEVLLLDEQQYAFAESFDPVRHAHLVIEHVFPQQGFFVKFKTQLAQFLQHGDQAEDHEHIISDIFTLDNLQSAIENASSSHTIEELLEQFLDTEGAVLTSEKAEHFAQAFERFLAKIADVPELDRSFVDSLESSDLFAEYVLGFETGEQERLKFTGEENYREDYWNRRRNLEIQQGFSTHLQYRTYYFAEYLDAHGLGDLAEAMRVGTSIDQIKRALTQPIASLDILANSVRDLKAQLKQASPDSRKLLSSQLKNAQEQYDSANTAVQGMIQYFDQATHIAAGLKRIGKHILDSLKVTGTNQADTLLELDGRPDNTLDLDPGHISGDCTADKPLPFAEKNIPLFNIKVRMAGRHIGNIYLLKTTEQSQGRAVWHLDAIQIPSQRIEWSAETVLRLITPMAEAAAAQGVAYITVNREPQWTSNYDYIQNGITDYLAQAQSERLEINQPVIPRGKGYSRLQGDGTVRVLWAQKQS